MHELRNGQGARHQDSFRENVRLDHENPDARALRGMRSRTCLVGGLAVSLALAACGGIVGIGSDVTEQPIGSLPDGSSPSSSGDGSGGDGGSGAVGTVACPFGMPDPGAPKPTDITYQRGCTTAADCSIALHLNNCCGQKIALGARASESPRFAADTGICGNENATYHCHCDSVDGTLAEDGELSGFVDNHDIAVRCNQSRCGTFVALFACGDKTCDSRAQICETYSPGIALADGGPPATSYTCSSLPAACTTNPTCPCVTAGKSSIASCDESKGHVTVGHMGS